jgi:hypothetical protein
VKDRYFTEAVKEDSKHEWIAPEGIERRKRAIEARQEGLGLMTAATARNRRIRKQARQFLRDVISGSSQNYQGFTFHEE